MRVVFRLSQGSEHTVEGEAGESLMRIAVTNDIPGIYGDCGGQCACATCHVYIDAEWLPVVGVPAAGSTEEALLEGAPADVGPNSRLSCQILLSSEMDGLVVHVPEGQ